MNHSIAVLMYHAVADAADPGADPHYTVSRPTFAEHLRTMHSQGRKGLSVEVLRRGESGEQYARAVGITFDDGHASNLHAAETLAAVGMSADFFINPSTVGTTCFLDWQAIHDMHQMGMSIQSHGMSHRYLNDLSAADVHRELVDSKSAIEDRLGAPVTLFAPPGGRKPEGFARAAAKAGYEAICSSDVGIWQLSDAPTGEPALIPRFAVLAGTSRARLGRWMAGSSRELALMQVRARVLTAAKRAVGNQRYERLRERFVGVAVAHDDKPGANPPGDGNRR